MQEVNLLSEDLKPRDEPFKLRELAIAWTLLILLLGTMSGWQAHSNWSLAQEAKAKRKELALLMEEISTLKDAAVKQPDSLLTQNLAALTIERDDHKKLLAVLEREPVNTGFYGHLRDLARIEMRKLWFDSIALAKGGKQIRLAGYSESAELVPLYLSMLSEGAAFSGYSFDGLQIKRESDVLVSFEVHGPLAQDNP